MERVPYYIRCKKVHKVLALLHEGNVNSVIDDNGWTTLHHATDYCTQELVVKCLELGADIDKRTIRHHWTALLLLASSPYQSHDNTLDIMRILIEAGADLWAYGTESRIAIEYALLREDYVMAALLLDYGSPTTISLSNKRFAAIIAQRDWARRVCLLMMSLFKTRSRASVFFGQDVNIVKMIGRQIWSHRIK